MCVELPNMNSQYKLLVTLLIQFPILKYPWPTGKWQKPDVALANLALSTKYVT